MSLVARELEQSGLPTVIIGSALDIVEHCGVPRYVFTDFPLGNPCGHPWQRDMQREIARSRMMAKVPTADVIVTNPAHFAVALKYDHAVMRAPVLVAKGADLIALQIRQIGGAASVPIVTSPLLARSLYHTAELDQEIPVGLYRAVAQVLAHVFRLRDSGKRFGAEPIDMADVPVPQDFQHY